jgi:UrcA family protein
VPRAAATIAVRYAPVAGEIPYAGPEIGGNSSGFKLILTRRHSRSPDHRRTDMTNSMLRFFPLAMVLATASVAAVAQQSDQPDVKIEAGEVQQTMVGLSDAGTPIERFWADRKVSYADLDLTTTSGATELMRRLTEAAKEACEQVHTADPVDLSDMDDTSCMRIATDVALKQAKAAIGQQRNPTVRFPLPK